MAEAKKRGNPNITAKKGEPGYFERNTDAAHQAAAEAAAIFPTAEEFTAAANRFFDECDAGGELYGEAGLCLALSKYNAKGKAVSLRTLQGWWDGENCPHLKDAVQLAYLRIQRQIETDERYREKGGMATKAIFLLKQKRFGGYQDRTETRSESSVRIVFGGNMDRKDFE